MIRFGGVVFTRRFGCGRGHCAKDVELRFLQFCTARTSMQPHPTLSVNFAVSSEIESYDLLCSWLPVVRFRVERAGNGKFGPVAELSR